MKIYPAISNQNKAEVVTSILGRASFTEIRVVGDKQLHKEGVNSQARHSHIGRTAKKSKTDRTAGKCNVPALILGHLSWSNEQIC